VDELLIEPVGKTREGAAAFPQPSPVSPGVPRPSPLAEGGVPPASAPSPA
jgi:hypothetical protein